MSQKETTLEQFVKYFEKYGEVIDSVIMKDRHTGRPRGFGFITYVDPSVVDTVIAETHNINDKQVEIKKADPKKPSRPASGPAYGSESRGRAYNDSYDGGFGDSYNNFGSDGGFGTASYRSAGGMSGRFGNYGYGGGEFGSYRGDPSLG